MFSNLSSEYETRIIDDVLKVSGVSIKPTENQLKEFVKRIKTLNKEIVFKILKERLINLQCTEDANQIKILNVKNNLYVETYVCC